ncbi:MAG: hypothetical protein AAB737_01340, partial [Patescibacteria group bacterium]
MEWIKFRGVAWGAGQDTGPASCGDPSLACGFAKSWKVEIEGNLAGSNRCIKADSRVCPVAVAEFGKDDTRNHRFKITAFFTDDCTGRQVGTPFDESIEIGDRCNNTTQNITGDTPIYSCEEKYQCKRYTVNQYQQDAYKRGSAYFEQDACKENCAGLPPLTPTPTPIPPTTPAPAG